jgi:hypothetical protein
MIVLNNVQCNANSKRGLLHHSFFENHINNTSAEFQLIKWQNHRTWDILESRHVRKETNKLDYLENHLESGFSPALLLEKYPLSELPEETKEKLKTVLQIKYYEQTGIVKIKPEFITAKKAFLEAYNKLAEAWVTVVPNDVNQDAFKEVLAQFFCSANKLDNLLLKLPKGIVLP